MVDLVVVCEVDGEEKEGALCVETADLASWGLKDAEFVRLTFSRDEGDYCFTVRATERPFDPDEIDLVGPETIELDDDQWEWLQEHVGLEVGDRIYISAEEVKDGRIENVEGAAAHHERPEGVVSRGGRDGVDVVPRTREGRWVFIPAGTLGILVNDQGA